MASKGRGWQGESRRHSLASKGIKTTDPVNSSPFVYSLDDNLMLKHLPLEIQDEINRANTPENISRVLSRRELEIGEFVFRRPHDEAYLMCDEMHDLLGDILTQRGIEYESIVGMNDNADSHVWIRVDGIDLDPTKQGTWDDRNIERALKDNKHIPEMVLEAYRGEWI